MPLKLAQENQRVLLISSDGKRFLLRLRAGERFHTHKGTIDHDDLIDKPLGRQVFSHLQHPFVVLEPSIHDLLMHLRRVSQIIYPKEIGQILLRLDICSGKRVIEAGTGSGALTTALAYFVRPGGMVYSYEVREDMLRVARKNIRNAGLDDYVKFTQRDIQQGFDEREVDALFLDVREPWLYLEQASQALADGGFFGALVPTTNQVSTLLAALKEHPFVAIEVLEILLRKYKPVAERLRPQDQMVGHTGFLIFARKVSLEPSASPAVGEASACQEETP